VPPTATNARKPRKTRPLTLNSPLLRIVLLWPATPATPMRLKWHRHPVAFWHICRNGLGLWHRQRVA